MNHSVLAKPPLFNHEQDHAYDECDESANERPFLNHFCYLYITKTSSERPNWGSTSGLLARRNIVPKDMLDTKVLESFFDNVGQFVRTLEGVGPTNAPYIRSHRLTSDEPSLRRFLSGRTSSAPRN